MKSDVDNAPLWRESEPNPPLSLRAAIAKAGEVVKRIPDSTEWKLNSITLERVGSRDGMWVYLVRFKPYQKDTITLGPAAFIVPILLDGKTPELKVK